MVDPALVELIYEASLVPERWVLVLDEMARICDAEGGLLFADQPDRVRWISSSRIQALVAEWVGSKWLQHNDRGHRLIPRRDPRFLTDLDGFTREELDRTPMYTEFLRPRGLGWCAGTTVRVPDGDTLVFSVEKAFDRGPVAASAVRVLDELRPDLARAVVLSARLGLERAHATVEAFQLLGLPAVLLRADGRVLAANRAVDALRGTVSTGAGDAMIFSDPRTHRLYQEALAALSCSLLEERASAPRGRSIPLVPLGGGARVVAHLLPVTRSARDLFTGAGAFLYVTSVASRPGPEVKLLELLFDLTPAEARIAGLITEGHSVHLIARQQQITPNTVRRHLKAVFAKTGVHRQAELVSLLGGAGHPLPRGQSS
jgi:DNA-binding CsgD family transcriptional regulator